MTAYVVRALSPGWRGATVTVPASARRHTFAALQPGAPWRFSVWAVSGRGKGLAATWAKAVKLAPGDNGYVIAMANGAMAGFGSLSSSGGTSWAKPGSQIAGIAAAPDGLGYFEVTSTGTVRTFGDARYHGSAVLTTTEHVVGITARSDGRGYWLLLNTGAVRAFGAAHNYGGVKAITDAIGIAATADGKGYYIARANGVVKAFGDARFRGDEAGKHLTSPIVGVSPDPVAAGYWLVAADGAVYAFGKARVHGSETTVQSTSGAVAIVATPDGRGYWLLAADGKVFNFGTARRMGDAPAGSPAVGIATA